jgi:serine/threonine protein kinase
MSQLGTLSGLRVDKFHLHESLGSGSFGEVYRALVGKGRVVAIKVARQELELRDADINSGESIALGLYSGAYAGIHPAPERLLQLQCERSAQAQHLFPDTAGPFRCGELQYLVMEYLDGVSLARFFREGADAKGKQYQELSIASKLYELLMKLRCSKLAYHGDIKPQNIMVTSKGLRFIDPGYFGPLACREGLIPNAVLSTPAYYPCMEPDDAFAAGVVFWELCRALFLLLH